MDEAESVQEAGASILKAEEEEVSPPRGRLGTASAGQEEASNGLSSPEIQESCSPGTSFWTVSENTDSPFLLNPIPGPSFTEDPDPPSKVTPGRDHRRYYHGYWRLEYLMDFDPHSQGMICMVCGSSLATLKLSTIKRHIKQKHPYSLLWSQEDKDVIRSGWDNHLSRESSQGALLLPADAPPEGEDVQEEERHSAGTPGGALSPAAQHPSAFDRLSPSPSASPAPDELQGPPVQVMERYLNDSLHAWFRQEFLMEYQAEAGRLLCMVCGALLPSLHLDHIKSHMLELHPNSLLYTAEEKHAVLQAWAKMHGEEPLQGEVELEVERAGRDAAPYLLHLDLKEETPEGDQSPADAVPRAHYQPRKRRLKYGTPWRLRLEYLVAFGPPEKPLCYCMVCSEHLPVPRVTKFRAHIQSCHPESSSFSQSQRDAVVRAWVSDEGPPGATPPEPGLKSAPPFTEARARTTEEEEAETEDAHDSKNNHRKGKPTRHSHYPGKDQRRNYQTRWKTDFLMDYDCRKHGLICMVCGATLATVKVSTIKRHILQVHPHSLHYSAEEKRLALRSYGQISPHAHSDQCFLGLNKGFKEEANGEANASPDRTSSPST